MLLSKILDDISFKTNIFKDIEINSIETDSRLIKKNSIFCAIDGKTNRGVNFVDEAIKNGAVVIVINYKESYDNNEIIVLKTENVSETTQKMLKNFYNNKFPEHLMGIGGTKGKTSVAEFVRQALENLGYNSGSIGTLGVNYKNKPIVYKDDCLTTRELVDFYKQLNFLKKEKDVDYVIAEVTSQGLDTGRMEGFFPEIVGFNNFSQDHLNYHKTMEEYFRCKMLMFREHCTENTKIVLNADIKEFDIIKNICEEVGCDKNIISFGYNGDVKLLSVDLMQTKQNIIFEFLDRVYTIKSNLIGEFQAMNLLCAFCFIYHLHISEDINKIIQALEIVETAEGRMTLAGITKNGASIYIDFAHTASSLECVLKTVRQHIEQVGYGRSIMLFGLGGQKDTLKRPIMGRISQNMADITIITNDNFRDEDPAKIRAEIIAGCEPGDPNVYNFDGTREDAIKFAISLLKKGDILVLAGKGHEKYTVENGVMLYFNEFEIVKNNI